MSLYNLENPIEQETVKEVWKYLGIKGSKLNILGETGYPDRIFWVPNGNPFFIEFKQPGNEPRPKQLEIHAWLRQLGYKVEVHDNVSDAFQAVIQAVGTTQISKESRQVLARARRRWVIIRSRSW